VNRSTARKVSAVFAIAVVALSLSPLAAHAQVAPGTGSPCHLDVAYGDGDEGPYYVDTCSVTPTRTPVALAPGDVLFGDADQGAIAVGPALVTAADATPTRTGQLNGDEPAVPRTDFAPLSDDE
jgi:hypothetical protein